MFTSHHVSHVSWQVWCFTCHVSQFFFCKVVELGWVWGQWHLTNSCWPSWANHEVDWTHKIQFPLLDTLLHTAHKIQFSIAKYSLACPLLPAKARLLNLPTPSQELGKCPRTQCMQAIVTSKIVYQLKNYFKLILIRKAKTLKVRQLLPPLDQSTVNLLDVHNQT